MFGTLGISNEKLTKRPGKNRNIWLVPVCGTEQGVVFTLNLKQGIKFHYQIS